MAVNPLQWNPIRANFGDATGMMQSAGQSIGRATDTVGNIFKQAQEAERQRLEQEDMLKRRVMEEKRLGIAQERADREAETYNTEREGTALGLQWYNEFNKEKEGNKKLTLDSYIRSKDLTGFNPAEADIGLAYLTTKHKEDQDSAIRALDRATKENEYNTLKEVRSYNLDYSKSLDELKTDLKSSKLSQGAQNQVLDTFGKYKVMENTLDKLADIKASKVTKEEKESFLASFNSLSGKPQEQNKILINFMMNHSGDPEAQNMAKIALENNYRLMGIEADKAKAYANSVNTNNKDLKSSLSKFSNDKSIYVAERLKGYGLEESDIDKLTKQLDQILVNGNGVGLTPMQLYSIYDVEGKTSGSHMLGILGGDDKYGEDAKREIQGFEDELITTINGTSVIDTRNDSGVRLLKQLEINADNLGVPLSSIPIITNTYEILGAKGEKRKTKAEKEKEEFNRQLTPARKGWLDILTNVGRSGT